MAFVEEPLVETILAQRLIHALAQMRTDIDGAGRIFDNPDETMPFFDRQRDQILFVAGFHAERIGEADATQLAIIGERPAMIWGGEATARAALPRKQPAAAIAAEIQICPHRPIRNQRTDQFTR